MSNREMKSLMDSWRQLVLEASTEHSDSLSIIDGKKKIKVDTDDEDEDLENDEDEIDEWKKEDDDDYPSRKKRRREKRAHKPDRSSWAHGADELVNGGLAKGSVGLRDVTLEKKQPKKQCNDGSPYHGDDGRFVNPDKEKGSYSMRKPTADSPDDCTWGKASRKSANRSRQAVRQPCGRGAKHRCKDGTPKWEAKTVDVAEADVNEGKQEQLEAYLSGVISQELERAIQKHMKNSGCSFNQLIQAMTAWANAEKGGAKNGK